jgi:hypothetical protein
MAEAIGLVITTGIIMAIGMVIMLVVDITLVAVTILITAMEILIMEVHITDIVVEVEALMELQVHLDLIKESQEIDLHLAQLAL